MYACQSAVNEVFFDRFLLGLGHLRVFLLDPYEWAGQEGWDARVLRMNDTDLEPLVLYHQHAKGGATKKARLIEKGLWII